MTRYDEIRSMNQEVRKMIERTEVEVTIDNNELLKWVDMFKKQLQQGYEVERVDKITHRGEETLLYILARYER